MLNWTFERHGLPRKEIEEALQHPVNVIIPFASDTFVQAINKGAPPVLESPTSPLTGVLEDFAYYVSRVEHQQSMPAYPTETWRRVTTRIQQRKQKRP